TPSVAFRGHYNGPRLSQRRQAEVFHEQQRPSPATQVAPAACGGVCDDRLRVLLHRLRTPPRRTLPQRDARRSRGQLAALDTAALSLAPVLLLLDARPSAPGLFVDRRRSQVPQCGSTGPSTGKRSGSSWPLQELHHDLLLETRIQRGTLAEEQL